MRSFFLFLAFAMASLTLAGDKTPTTQTTKEKVPKATEDRSSWDYVPKTLAEAHEQLERLLPKEETCIFIAMVD